MGGGTAPGGDREPTQPALASGHGEAEPRRVHDKQMVRLDIRARRAFAERRRARNRDGRLVPRPARRSRPLRSERVPPPRPGALHREQHAAHRRHRAELRHRLHARGRRRGRAPAFGLVARFALHALRAESRRRAGQAHQATARRDVRRRRGHRPQPRALIRAHFARHRLSQLAARTPPGRSPLRLDGRELLRHRPSPALHRAPRSARRGVSRGRLHPAPAIRGSVRRRLVRASPLMGRMAPDRQGEGNLHQHAIRHEGDVRQAGQGIPPPAGQATGARRNHTNCRERSNTARPSARRSFSAAGAATTGSTACPSISCTRRRRRYAPAS